METFEREDRFEAGETHAERVLRFLARNDDKAFERGEIADATGLDPNAVSAVLSRLKDRSLVRHKAPYWAIGEPDRLATATDFDLSLDSLNETLGAESMEEWQTAGTDAADPGNPEDG